MKKINADWEYECEYKRVVVEGQMVTLFIYHKVVK